MKEIIGIPTFLREELLHCCLRRVREINSEIEVHVFPDRGTADRPNIKEICRRFDARIHFVPDHDYFGNSYNVMEIYRWAHNYGCDLFYMLESDIMVHSDYFAWHREVQEEFPDIFASMAWIFNRHAPIEDGLLFQPWIYSPGITFSQKKLKLVAKHATPKYYNDLAGYVERNFKTSPLNVQFAIQHFEQDGLLQRILDEDKSQTVCPGIAKCSHVGFTRSYGGDTQEDYERFLGLEGLRFDERVERVEEFIADEHWRAQVFGRAIVEREVGHTIAKREFEYLIKLPGGWESVFKSELKKSQLPKRVNSVNIPKDAEIMLSS